MQECKLLGLRVWKCPRCLTTFEWPQVGLFTKVSGWHRSIVGGDTAPNSLPWEVGNAVASSSGSNFLAPLKTLQQRPLQQSVKLPSALVTPKPVKAHLPPPMVSSHFIASRPSRAKCWLYKLQVPHWNWLNWGVPWQIFQQLPCNIVGIHFNHANIGKDPLVR